MPVSGPDRCPECNYNLHGLPPPHRCPECGFEYDEHTLIWRPPVPWTFTLLVLFFLAAYAYITISGAPDLIRKRTWFGIAMLLTFGVVLAAPAAYVWRIVVTIRRGRYVAITPAGIRARGHALFRGVLLTLLSPTAVEIPWTEVTGFAISRDRRWTVIIKRRQPLDSIRIFQLLSSSAEAEQFVRAADVAHRRHPAPQEPPGTTPALHV